MPRLSAPLAILTSAVVLASVSAGSYAAGTLITSKQIKDGTIQVKDLNRKAVTQLRGAAGPVGPAGSSGATGVAGANGAAGQRGFSAWDPIPSGQMVTGRFVVIDQAQAAGSVSGAIGELPGRPHADLAAGVNVFFAPGSLITPDPTLAPTDARCSGTRAAPTAPAGIVCVYLTGVNGKGQFATAPYFSSTSFGVAYVAAAAGSASATGSWAYTAP